MAPELTVLIACRGHAAPLTACLAALERQTLDPARFEVLVVDDGSQPPLALSPTTLPLRVLAQAPAGPAAARNLGLRHARGALVLFLNADALPHPELLERHLAHHAASPEPRAVLGRFDFLPEHVTPFLALAEACGTLFPYHLVGPDRPLHFTFFWTGDLSAPKAALDAVGGFDERFRRPLFEDTELGYRLARHGLPLYFGPDLDCGHDHPITLAPWLARAEAFGHEWTLFCARHGEAAMPILAAGGVAAPPPSDDELWALCLHEHAAHAARLDALRALLAGPDVDHTLREGVPLLEAINLVARMRGVLAGRLGHTPEELARHRNRTLALVHTLLDARDLEPLDAILHALPEDAHLLLSHDLTLTDALGAHPVSADPRARLVPFSDSPWVPLLAASPADTFVLLSGALIPPAADLTTLASYLDLNPSLGVVTLGPPGLAPTWTAALASPERAPAEVVATTRAALATDTDRPAGLGFFARVAARGLRLALATPPASRA